MSVNARGRTLVIGASSQVGRFVLPRLAALGLEVDALSRTGPPEGYPEFDGLGWVDAATAKGRLGEYTQLVSAGPLDLAFDYANAMTAIRSIAVTSSSSVLSKATSPDESERELVESLREAEEGLRRVAREGRVPLVILRPTLIYGCGLDRNLTLMADLIQRFGWMPISTRAGGLRQPLHADDVAQALVRALSPRDQRELVSPLCGGDTVDYRGMVRRIFTALDRPPRFLTLPPSLLAGSLSLARGLRLSQGLGPEMVHRQAMNLVFDDREARTVLGVRPRRFRPDAEAFVPPDEARLRRLSSG